MRRVKQWKCPHCDQTSSRHWNLKIHIKRKHGGIGVPVKERESMQFVPDMGLEGNNYQNLYACYSALRRNKEVLFKKSHYDAPEIVRDLVEMIQPWMELKKQLRELYPTTQDLRFSEFLLLQQQQQQDIQSYIHDLTPYTAVKHDGPDIFGFRLHSCYRCMITTLAAVFYDNNDQGEIANEMIHVCNPSDITANENRPNRNKLMTLANDIQLERLKSVIYASPKHRYKHLVAVRAFNREKVIKITNPLNPKLSISFSFAKEVHIELDEDSANQSDNNISKCFGIYRAIANGHTELSDIEVWDFLQLTRKGTFAFFDIKKKGHVSHFFIALSSFLYQPER